MPSEALSQAESAPRAFLSHSSADAELVRAAAAQVKRPFVRLDYYEFRSGDEILQAIDDALQQSSLFVLFASRSALSSLWVDVEVDSARYEVRFGRLKKVLVVLLDDTLQLNDLPSWMRRYKCLRSRAARPIARMIRGQIDDLMRERQHSVFVNRTKETSELQEVMAPTSGRTPPPVFGVVGIDGIGRRTLLQRVARDTLSLERLLPIDLESGDSVNDIAVKIADLVEPASSTDDAIRLAREIESISESDAVARAVSDARTALALGELPVLVDKGGMLDSDARLNDSVTPFLDAVANAGDMVVALVSPRRPRLPSGDLVPVVRIAELPDADVRRLVGLLAKQRSRNFSTDEIADLSNITRGYPPSARYVVDLADYYGVAVTATQTTRAAEFRMRPVRAYLRTLDLSQRARDALRVLAGNSPLALEALGEVLGLDIDSAGSVLVDLIDSSLVTPTSSGWYRIVDPVVDALIGEVGPATKDDYSKVAVALESFLDSSSGDAPALLELTRVRYRALLQSGSDTDERFAFALAADWVRSAKDLYHRRDYEQAERVARLALDARPDNPDVRAYLIRALIKQGNHTTAHSEIAELRRRGEAEEAAFLQGFLFRHQSQFSEAVKSFEAARRMGRRGVSLDRELANCYLELGDVDHAKERVEAARLRQGDNRFVIDMAIRIACHEGNEVSARELLGELADVDDPAFHAFRRSRVELYFGEPRAVLDAATAAVEASKGRPSFEIQAQLVVGLAMVGRVDVALDELSKLKQMYPGRSLDVQRGLACRIQIASGRYDDALATWEKLDEKERPVHLRLKRDALRGLLDHTNVAFARRSDIEKEVAALERRLERVGRGTAQDLVGGLAADT